MPMREENTMMKVGMRALLPPRWRDLNPNPRYSPFHPLGAPVGGRAGGWDGKPKGLADQIEGRLNDTIN